MDIGRLSAGYPRVVRRLDARRPSSYSVAVDDEAAMAEALVEARRGIGRTSPNPPVGAVVVSDGRVIGRGWHRRAGEGHAERAALADAVNRVGAAGLRGSTVFVTLEPCSTHGRTPPCTEALIDAGCVRVVYGTDDPNPSHAGRAAAELAGHGIEVCRGVLEDECRQLIRGFAQVQRNQRPRVIAKLAMSLDGRLTRPPGEGMWLTGPEARAEVQRIRAECDAIVTSGKTLRRDDPALTIRVPELLECRDMPWRVVLTNNRKELPELAQVFTDEWRERTLVRDGGKLAGMLKGLATEQGCCTVMLECGGRLAGAFFDAGLVDEVVTFLAPMVNGGDVPAVGGGGAGAMHLDRVAYRRFGDDVMLRALVVR